MNPAILDVPTSETDQADFVEGGRFRRTVVDPEVSPGLTLAAARAHERQPLSFYSRRLNIPERYLKALEAEQFHDLPGLVYEKHFVARYAEALRLDVDAVVAQWITLRENEAKPIARFAQRVRRSDMWVSPFLGKRLVFGVMFFVMAAFLGTRVITLMQPPALEVMNPTNDAVIQESHVVVSGTAALDATVMINDQLVSATDGHFTVPIVLDSGTNTIRVVAERRFGRSAVIERRVFMAENRVGMTQVQLAGF